MDLVIADLKKYIPNTKAEAKAFCDAEMNKGSQVKFTMGMTVASFAVAQQMAQSSVVKDSMIQVMATKLSYKKRNMQATLTANQRRLAADWVATMPRRLAPALNVDYIVTVFPTDNATAIQNRVTRLQPADVAQAVTQELSTTNFAGTSLSVTSISSPTVQAAPGVPTPAPTESPTQVSRSTASQHLIPLVVTLIAAFTL